MKLYASAIALKDCSVPRIRGDDPVPGKRAKAATKLFLIRKDGSYCAGSDWRSAVARIESPEPEEEK